MCLLHQKKKKENDSYSSETGTPYPAGPRPLFLGGGGIPKLFD